MKCYPAIYSTICHIVVCCFICPVAFGQQITMPSTESSAMINNINVPVDKYTGVGGVSIPLFTVSTNGVQIPIGLSYKASGIRLDQRPTWVGLGWSLSAGGSITRVVRGQPDEYGYSRAYPDTPDGSIDYDRIWTLEEFNRRNDNYFDGEPDTYYFEIPGESGMFVITYTGDIVTIPRKDLIIRKVDSTYFTIQDSRGVIYSLGSDASSRELSQYYRSVQSITYTTTWYLDTVYYNNTKVVEITYRNGGSENYITKNKMRTFLYSSDENGRRVEERDEVQENVQHLSVLGRKFPQKIKWDNGYIEFITRGTGYASPLQMMCINNPDGTNVKRIHFRTGEFVNRGTKLLGLSESGDNKLRKICDFSYFEEHSMLAYDFDLHCIWDVLGYYNTPSLKSYLTHKISGLEVAGAPIEPSLEYTRTYTLQKIIYPNGGYKEFRYGLNKYYDSINNKTVAIGGLRVEDILDCDAQGGIISRISYLYDKNGYRRGGRLNPNYHGPRPITIEHSAAHYNGAYRESILYGIPERYSILTNDISGCPVSYPEVTEVFANGSFNIYKYRSLYDVYDIPGDMKQIVMYNNWHPVNMEAGFTNENYVPYSLNAFQRGMEKEVAKYGDNNALLSKTTNYFSLFSDYTSIIPAVYLIKKISICNRKISNVIWLSIIGFPIP